MCRLCLFAALLLPLSGSAQLTGTFSLDKTTFAPGEPVFLHLTLTNSGTQPLEIRSADPYSAVSEYTIHVSRQGTPFTPCSRGFNGSGLSGVRELAPHASWSESLLLNYPLHTQGDLNPPVRLPGDYLIDAVKQLEYGPPGWSSHVFHSPSQSTVHQVLSLTVDPTLQPGPATYAPYVQQLAARDEPTRKEAARVLATLAPPALEPLLLTFPTSKDRTLRQFAPLALATLGTQTSLSALAAMLAAAEPGTYESDTAALYLGRAILPRHGIIAHRDTTTTAATPSPQTGPPPASVPPATSPGIAPPREPPCTSTFSNPPQASATTPPFASSAAASQASPSP